MTSQPNVAINLSQVAAAHYEALDTSLGWEVYCHGGAEQ